MKTRFKHLTLFIALLLCMVQFVSAADFTMNITYQGNGKITVSGKTAPNENTNIIIQKDNTLHYIDTQNADETGAYSFDTVLAEQTTFDCSVTSQGETQKKTFITKMPEASDDQPEIQKSTITFSIDKLTIDKGYTVSTQEVIVTEGESVWEVTKRVLDEKGIQVQYSFTTQYDSIYVESIDGDGEFDHGTGSGWMYSLNGVYPQTGCSKQYVHDGDVVKWRYTTNLGKDIGASESIGAGGGSGGGAGGGAAGSAIVQEVVTDTKGNASVALEMNPVLNSVSNNATVTVDKALIEKAIEKINAASNTNKKEVNLVVPIDEKVKEMKVDLSKEIIDACEAHVDAVVLTTSIATLQLDHKTLQTLQEKSSEAVSISVLKEDKAALQTELNKEQLELVGNRPIVSFNITSGTKKISEFAGAITIAIPYTIDKDEEPQNLKIYYLPESAAPVIMKDAYYDTEAEQMIFNTNHFSTFAVAYEEEAVKDEVDSLAFTDVAKEAWYYKPVQFAVQNKLFAGITETTFEPSKPMTRGMFYTVLHRLSGDTTFTGGKLWYEDGMNWAKELGISDGTSPNAAMTREQLATMLYRYEGAQENAAYTGLNTFTDLNTVSDWAVPAMSWAHHKGIIEGRTETTLAPKDLVTRAEVATIMMRYLEDADQ